MDESRGFRATFGEEMSFALQVGLASTGAVGFLLVLYGLICVNTQKVKSILSANKKAQGKRPDLFDWILDKLPIVKRSEEKTDIMLSVLDIQNKTARDVTKKRLFCGLLGVALAMLLRNVMVIPLLVFVFANIPVVLLGRKTRKRRMIYNDQVLEAFQVFVTDYTTTKSVQKTLENVCSKIKRPLRNEFERLTRKLYSGISANECFLDLSKRTQSQWVMYFSQVMMMYFQNGGDFVPHLTGIIRTMSSEKLIEEQNLTELSSLRTINLVLVLLFPIVFVASVFVAPDTLRVFTETVMGRNIIFFSIAGCIFSLIVGQKISEN